MSEQSKTNHQAVRQAVLDYVEGVYEADPARIERSVHPDLVKGGFFVEQGQTAYSFTAMTFPQLVELALHYNRDGRMPADAAKEVTIYDVTDQVASVKLVAWWGIDYMHLAKYDGTWKIVHVLWQAHPNQSNRLFTIPDELQDQEKRKS